jgi:hypothetical protein
MVWQPPVVGSNRIHYHCQFTGQGEFGANPTGRKKPGMARLEGHRHTPERSAIEDAVQVFSECQNVFALGFTMGYKDFLFHTTPPLCNALLQPDSQHAIVEAVATR